MITNEICVADFNESRLLGNFDLCGEPTGHAGKIKNLRAVYNLYSSSITSRETGSHAGA